MLSVIPVREADKWDQIVKSLKNYDVYYLSGYAKASQLHGDGEPILFYYLGEKVRAINVVMKRDISRDVHYQSQLPEGTYFDIATPYGYGGFLIDDNPAEDSLKRLDEEYSALCKSKGIISEAVRFHPVLENSKVLKKIYDVSSLGRTVIMNLNSLEQIWDDLASESRNMVRKAQKAGVEIHWGHKDNLKTTFREIYNATMEKKHARDYYFFGEDYYSCLLDDFNDHACIFYALYKNRVIAMSIILFANQQMHYHLSASDIEYRHLPATNLLLYEAACWGCENGYRTFHLGGGLGSREDSLYRFKRAFNRNSSNTFEIGKKIFDKRAYRILVDMRIEALGGIDSLCYTGYFPAYRAEINESV